MSAGGLEAALGLCSVTLRALPPECVVSYARAAELHRVEWGADIHAPAGDPDRLAEVRELSIGGGLLVCSYGSYFRAGCHPLEDVRAAIRAATLLGTDRVRIWAGDTGSVDADAQTWDRTTRAVQDAASAAQDEGCLLAFEFHGGTLTDTPHSALELLERVDRSNVSTYWQPPVDVPAELAIEGLQALIGVVSAVHIFSWWPGTTRVPVADRPDLWTAALDLVGTQDRDIDLLLEFVPDDDPALLAREAATVRGWIVGTGA